MCEKQLLGRELHNKTNRAIPIDTSGWYTREENNGWRPIVVCIHKIKHWQEIYNVELAYLIQSAITKFCNNF